MKKVKILLFGFLLVLAFNSCEKDSEGNTIIGVGAKIDGDSWNAPLPVTVLYNNTFTITGTSLLGKVIIINIKGKSVGTYNLSVLPPVADCGCTYKSSLTSAEQDWFLSVSGTVTLTKVDETNKKISGTFEFTVSNTSFATKTISGGVFNDIGYMIQD